MRIGHIANRAAMCCSFVADIARCYPAIPSLLSAVVFPWFWTESKLLQGLESASSFFGSEQRILPVEIERASLNRHGRPRDLIRGSGPAIHEKTRGSPGQARDDGCHQCLRAQCLVPADAFPNLCRSAVSIWDGWI